jgi:hypothetical protein
MARASGESQATIAHFLRQFVRTGYLPIHMENQRQIFTEISQLMFVREGVRYTPALAHAAMTTELMAMGQQIGGLTPAEAFGTARSPSALPMAMVREVREVREGITTTRMEQFGQSTPAAARALEKRHEKVEQGKEPGRAGSGRRTQELVRREAALVRQWIQTQLQIKDLIYPSIEEARAHIETLIQELLHRFFQARTQSR